MTECWSILGAEDIYTALLRHDASRVAPGAKGTSTYNVQGRELSAAWEVRENAVWRHGRVFLLCPRCSLRCTRLYVPLSDANLGCRQCWGLTYGSRTLRNYKESLWGGGMFAALFGTSQREMAFDQAETIRQERRERSDERWAERRRLLRGMKGWT